LSKGQGEREWDSVFSTLSKSLPEASRFVFNPWLEVRRALLGRRKKWTGARVAADATSARNLQIDAALAGPMSLDSLGLHDLESLRLLLRGGSVIDWRRLNLKNREEVDHFLRLHLLDYQDEKDRALLHRILADAVEYLRSTFRYRVAAAVANPTEIHDLFLFASGLHPRNPERYRKIACIVLKIMHVIHHIEGRELLFRTPVAESVLARMVDERVMARAEEMKRLGFPIVELTGNVKSQHSIITKLVAKRETVAAQIFDKVRYRIVTRELKDVVPVLVHLTHTLFPFNYVVPSQTENNLVSFRKVVERTPALRGFIDDLHLPLRHEAKEQKERRRRDGNPFSGSTYRVLNFIVDLPLRIDRYLAEEDRPAGRPRTVFALVEFQVLDQQTAAANELGDNSHDRYKHRQRIKVLRRLSRGLVVPKGESPDPKKTGAGGVRGRRGRAARK
jgi:uncharacterized protein (TIGR04552 family)